MTRNLTESFSNPEKRPDTPADYYFESISIRLIGCGVKRTAAAEIRDFLLPAFLAVYYQEGSAEIRHGGETTVLEPGSFYVFRPYDVYSGRRIGETPLCFTYLQFDIAPFVERFNFGTIAMFSADAIFQNARYRRYGETLKELAEDEPGKSGRAAMLRQFVRLLMAQVVYDRPVQTGAPRMPKKGRDSQMINRAFQYVAGHLSEPVVIGNLLKDGKTSKTSLERAFRSVLDTTPQRALLRFKIERSMEMLQQNASLKQVVRELGFSSVYHFSNTFKSITGIRPTEYRGKIMKSPR